MSDQGDRDQGEGIDQGDGQKPAGLPEKPPPGELGIDENARDLTRLADADRPDIVVSEDGETDKDDLGSGKKVSDEG